MMDYKLNKSFCEKYTFRFNEFDWAIFTLDSKGMFNCQSSWGNYNYHWSAFGNCFKSFLIDCDKGYLFGKLMVKDSFYGENFKKQFILEILKDRKEDYLTKKQARKLYEFIDSAELSTYDSTLMEINESYDIHNILDDIWNSNYTPNKEYSFHQIYFLENVFPLFQEVLKKEVEQKVI